MTNQFAILPSLRQQMRQQRRAFSSEQQHEHAQLLKHHLLALSGWDSPRAVGVAFAFDGEINPYFVVEALQGLGHHLYLPVLQENKQLQFAHWHSDSVMVNNKFGILEPHEVTLIDIEQLDIVFMPLVAVDKQGNRMGMGGGYYDRTLGCSINRPYLVGMAHYCQLVEGLPVQSWDVPLDALVTEQGMLFWRPWLWR